MNAYSRFVLNMNPARRDTAPGVDSINTFEEPNTVVPKPITAKVQDGKLTLTIESKSVTVVSLEP